MMDAQTQEKLMKHEEALNEAEYLRKLCIESQIVNIEDFEELLQIVREQETQLAKYESVVESAKNLVKKARENKAVTGDNGQPDWYEYSESDFDALTSAIDELEAK